MFILEDINQTWKPPEGMDLIGVYVKGGFLRVVYVKDIKIVHVVINHMGREVMRVHETRTSTPASTEKVLTPIPEPELKISFGGFFRWLKRLLVKS